MREKGRGVVSEHSRCSPVRRNPELIAATICSRTGSYGAWLSPVECLLREQEAGVPVLNLIQD